MGGISSNGTAGGRTRLGPVHGVGPMRMDITGSVRMLRPSTCTSTVAWPITVARIEPSSTLSTGGATGTSSTCVGHGPRERVASQRSTLARPCAVRPLALWKTPRRKGAASKALGGRGRVTSTIQWELRTHCTAPRSLVCERVPKVTGE